MYAAIIACCKFICCNYLYTLTQDKAALIIIIIIKRTRSLLLQNCVFVFQFYKLKM